MKVKVLFFGVLANKAGCSFSDFENIIDLDELMRNLKSKFQFLENAAFAVALNQVVVNGNAKLKDKDEIALLPPFAGG